MSKAVKSVGRAVGKVVKGVAKVAKKVWNSPIGRIVAMAAISFIGMPMLAGAINGAAAGSGFLGTLSGALEGAMSAGGAALSGIGNAASGLISGNMSLGQAANAVTTASGAPFNTGAVGDFLGNTGQMGVQGSQAAQSVQGAPRVDQLANAGNNFVDSVAGGAPVAAGSPAAPAAGLPGASAPGTAGGSGAGKGLLARMMESQYFVPAAMQATGSLITGVGNSLTTKAGWERQDDERKRSYDNWSVGNLVVRR